MIGAIGAGPVDLGVRRITLGDLLGRAAEPTGRHAAPSVPADDPPQLLAVRLGLGLACLALIAVGVGVSARSTSISEDPVAPVASSSPVVRATPVLDPGAYLSDLPAGSGVGAFSAPAYDPVPEPVFTGHRHPATR